jgi:predicted NAD-dependent protein-ADP-ribosyltransferase YbiA (DUF1768 family)
MDRAYIIGEPVLKFWSNGSPDFYKLSNFQYIEGGIQPFDDQLVFPSTEHAFQSRKYVVKDRARFSVNGDLGIVSGFSLVFREKEYEKKQKYWMKKWNIGIIAKMATNKTVGRRLKLEIDPDFKSTDELWLEILPCKYNKEPFKQLLKSTLDIYLLEFDRGAYHRFGVSLAFWGGNIIQNDLWGQNQMGKYLMQVRYLL